MTQEGIRGNEEFPDATHNAVSYTHLISLFLNDTKLYDDALDFFYHGKDNGTLPILPLLVVTMTTPLVAVSYTHLDVYKRQVYTSSKNFNSGSS